MKLQNLQIIIINVSLALRQALGTDENVIKVLIKTSSRYWWKRHSIREHKRHFPQPLQDNYCSFYGHAYHYELRRMVVFPYRNGDSDWWWCEFGFWLRKFLKHNSPGVTENQITKQEGKRERFSVMQSAERASNAVLNHLKALSMNSILLRWLTWIKTLASRLPIHAYFSFAYLKEHEFLVSASAGPCLWTNSCRRSMGILCFLPRSWIPLASAFRLIIMRDTHIL